MEWNGVEWNGTPPSFFIHTYGITHVTFKKLTLFTFGEPPKKNVCSLSIGYT